ncbi:hemolysin III family protein [Opitutales bacterium ASA1]|uniref:PAQR family membrane homeostasis protein TrhA n=1 Tax=Congregicoccus parvus TaxID=3081749 RepID=UPI002B2E01B4|nr:hemolysin III family protein [Opitutales bacterium ASA1]
MEHESTSAQPDLAPSVSQQRRRSSRPQSWREELANALTHGLGWALSIAGLAVAVVLAARHGDAWVVTSVAIHGATLVALYAASTLYHSVRSSAWKRWLRRLDHAAIFLLIAGTYTPFVLVNLRGPWGWSLFGVVWGIALTGVGFKLFFAGRFVLLSSAAYVLLGWLILIAIKPLLASVPTTGFALLCAGGVCYTAGVVFYLWRRLPYHHAVWHLFVLAGSICHYFAVLRSVV